MHMKNSKAHPGKILKGSLPEYGITQYALAKGLGIPHSRLTAIIQGKRSVTADTAVRLGRYFGNTPQFWLNLQAGYDLALLNVEQIHAQVTPHPNQPPSEIPAKVVELTAVGLVSTVAEIEQMGASAKYAQSIRRTGTPKTVRSGRKPPRQHVPASA